MHRSGNFNLQMILFGRLYIAVAAAKLKEPQDAGGEGCVIVISNRNPLLGCCQMMEQHRSHHGQGLKTWEKFTCRRHREGKTVQISQLTAVQRAAVGSSAPASLPAAVI